MPLPTTTRTISDLAELTAPDDADLLVRRRLRETAEMRHRLALAGVERGIFLGRRQVCRIDHRRGALQLAEFAELLGGHRDLVRPAPAQDGDGADRAFAKCGQGMADDIGTHRPGHRAAAEFDVRSPLIEAGLGKAEIRALAQRLGLPNWNKPSFACLSSRIAYGEQVTADKLRLLDEAERFIRTLGLTQFRVRHHDTIARLEVLPADLPIVIEQRERIVVLRAAASGCTHAGEPGPEDRRGLHRSALPRSICRAFCSFLVSFTTASRSSSIWSNARSRAARLGRREALAIRSYSFIPFAIAGC